MSKLINVLNYFRIADNNRLSLINLFVIASVVNLFVVGEHTTYRLVLVSVAFFFYTTNRVIDIVSSKNNSVTELAAIKKQVGETQDLASKNALKLGMRSARLSDSEY